MSDRTTPRPKLHPSWIWGPGILLLLALPLGMSGTSSVTILNQMGITIVLALSYNMLLGQTGMLSFGHAIYMGFGGFMCLHVMNHVQAADWPVPLPILPLFAGLFSMGMATLIGAFSTRRTGTVFAMISLGMVELIASFSIVIHTFFQGGGAGGDRTLGPTVFGVDFARQDEVYYLILGWVLICVAAMYGYTRTPLGRMANAVRDNPERAEYVGYSARHVRLASFIAAGFFAGIAGGLSALNYEIATAEVFSVKASGSIIMVAFLGGIGAFYGPVLGAVLFTLLQSVLSLYTDLWQLYLGLLFLAAVMFFPAGLAGLLDLHVARMRQPRWRDVIGPYLRVVPPAVLATLSLSALAEMVFHIRRSGSEIEAITLFWIQFDPTALAPWGLFAAIAGICLALAQRSVPDLKASWAAGTKPVATAALG